MPNEMQLFCFTHAGGTKAFYNVIEQDIQGIEVIALEYAGHGERYKEKCYEDFNALADDMFRMVRTRVAGDYGLFGYSMGSISLVEVLKRIISSDLALPKHIFLAAHEPHTKSELLGYSDDELDEWVKQRTILFGAVPEKLVRNNVFWRTYLPIYRSDYSIIGRYDFKKLELWTEIPATVFYSEEDTPFEDMKLWNRYFPCDFYQFSGTHFFIQQHHEDIVRIIEEKMGA